MFLSYKFILVVLLVIELIIFVISFIIVMLMIQLNLDFIILYYLIFSLCESVLGISILVLVVRFYGNEFYYFFNISKV